MLQAKLVHVLQSKLAVSTGGVKKHSKKGKKAPKAIALKGLKAAPAEGNAGNSPSRSPSPSSRSPEDEEEERELHAELGSSSNHSSVSQQANDSSHAAERAPNSSSEPEGQKNASPVSSTSDGDPLDGNSGPSGPKTKTEAATGGMQGLTPSKATPNKRPRETVCCSSPAANSPVVGLEQGPGGGVPEGTPGKRRRSLLPQSTLLKEVSQ